MEARETILKELNSISPTVANLGAANVFVVPEGYFDRFPASVLSRIQAETISFGGKSHPFKVPVNYFDQLAGNILNKIKSKEQSVEEELNELAPLLNTISKQPVYKIPEGYFESLELTIPLKLDKPSARVFSFGRSKRIMQYAVAACTAAILLIGAFLYTNNDKPEQLISHKEAVNMNVSTELDKLSETEIASYLDAAPNVGYALNASAEDISFDEYLEETSDEEIDAYLNESGEAGDKTSKGI
jgi:hypothetical protein